MSRVAIALALSMMLACGCSSDATSTPGDAGADGGVCGKTTCKSGEHCVHPCCGGAYPSCEPLVGGACPPGTQPTASCPPTGEPGCEATCSAPAEYCSTQIPAGCQLDATGEVVCACP